MLTVSAAPVSARQANVSQNVAREAEDDRRERRTPPPPRAASGPRRTIRSVSGTIAALVVERAHRRRGVQPAVALRRRRCRMSCAKIGSSAVADEKNVAKKSRSIVERISGDRKTKRSPSRAAPTRRRRRSRRIRGAAGTSRIISSAAMTHANEQALSDVDPADAARGDEQPAERRPGDRCDLHHDRVQADGVGQVLARARASAPAPGAPAGRRRRRPRPRPARR